MCSTGPLNKTHSFFRIAGVAILMLGVYLSNRCPMLLQMTFHTVQLRNWLLFTFIFFGFNVYLALSILLIYAGGRSAWQPDTANPRLLLLSLFTFIYLALYHSSVDWFPSSGLSGGARDLARLKEQSFKFGSLLCCSLLYYACCRWLRRLGELNETQRAALARRPSPLISFLLCVQCLALQGSLVNYLENKNPSYDPGLMVVIGFPLTIIIFVLIHRRLTHYLTLAGPDAPFLHNANEAPFRHEV